MPLAGRGAVWVVVFTHAVPFSSRRDNTYVNGETWPALKASGEAPYGQVPYLRVTEADGTKWVLAQGNSIVRFISKRYGHGGANDREEAVADSLIERQMDFRSALGAAAPYTDPERVPKAQKFLDANWAGYSGQLDKFLAANTTGSGFLVGAKFTGADIIWYSTIVYNLQPLGLKFELSAAQQKFVHAVEAVPGVAAFIKDAAKNPGAKQ